MTFLLGAAAGLVIGSFLNVCIFRLPEGESLFAPRSYCPSCHKTLSWWELIPLLGFLLVKGKCRYCRSPISWRYPLVEILTAVIFTVLLWRYGTTLGLIRPLLLTSALIVISAIDIEWYIIPNQILLFLLAGYLITIPLIPAFRPVETLLGGLAGGIFLFLPALIYPEGMGGGDIKMAAVLGIFLGWQQVLLVIFAATLAGSIMGITINKIQHKDLKEPIPFGPYLALGAIVSILYGNEILSLYWQVLTG